MNKPGSFIRYLLKPFKSKKANGSDDLEKIAAQEQKQFPYETLVSATKNFHPNQKLGEGGFGPVFKGKLEDGREIAVKKLSRGSRQGKKEFVNEAKLLTRVQHRNVVNLLGFSSGLVDKTCWIGSGGMTLFLAFLGACFTFTEDSHSVIIHRDIKAGNILLDDKWAPKIADFGLARLFPEDQTHVNTRVAGTNGYMAPEYVMHGHLSVKADVFSFGVVILELITGQKNSTFSASSDGQNLLEWVYKQYRKGKSMEVMDRKLASSAVPDQVATCIQIGLLCTQSDPQVRPPMRRCGCHANEEARKPRRTDEARVPWSQVQKVP
ncbi:hypothetical protein Vadar_004728 [Vaccinium darrowii]|uniref:Uncharacterized protein n=1 Tax=Vaccinium darrowii TaxID=229202 RepID=A0ACB7WXR1_9ERIC|nr:hypothetical protein Vadar_004728 [Vaccinium darrowii]